MSEEQENPNETHVFDFIQKDLAIVPFIVDKLLLFQEGIPHCLPPHVKLKRIETKETRVRVGDTYTDYFDIDFVFDFPHAESLKYQKEHQDLT